MELEPIILDGSRMTDRTAAHDHLMERLQFPVWYGRNLDALYDLLSSVGIPVYLKVTHLEVLTAWEYGRAILHTLYDAAEANENLHLEAFPEA